MLDCLLEQVKKGYKLEGHPFPRVGSKRRRALQAQLLRSLIQREMYAQKARHRDEPEWFDVPADDRDDLTGLYNRRSFHDALSREAAFARPDGEPLALLLFDIKGFRSINDMLGHLEGDRVLGEVARRIREVVGPAVKAYRLGSNQVAIILPKSRTDDAGQLLDRLRVGVSRRKVGDAGRVHFWAGVAEFEPGVSEATFFHRADDALYRLKRGERD
jgi:diguanylate cyclase (GGDEF)-like protein